jgi:hypothetical protein
MRFKTQVGSLFLVIACGTLGCGRSQQSSFDAVKQYLIDTAPAAHAPEEAAKLASPFLHDQESGKAFLKPLITSQDDATAATAIILLQSIAPTPDSMQVIDDRDWSSAPGNLAGHLKRTRDSLETVFDSADAGQE